MKRIMINLVALFILFCFSFSCFSASIESVQKLREVFSQHPIGSLLKVGLKSRQEILINEWNGVFLSEVPKTEDRDYFFKKNKDFLTSKLLIADQEVQKDIDKKMALTFSQQEVDNLSNFYQASESKGIEKMENIMQKFRYKVAEENGSLDTVKELPKLRKQIN